MTKDLKNLEVIISMVQELTLDISNKEIQLKALKRAQYLLEQT